MGAIWPREMWTKGWYRVGTDAAGAAAELLSASASLDAENRKDAVARRKRGDFTVLTLHPIISSFVLKPDHVHFFVCVI